MKSRRKHRGVPNKWDSRSLAGSACLGGLIVGGFMGTCLGIYIITELGIR